MSLHPAVEKERFGGFCSQFPYNDDSQHCDVHRTPQQSFRRTRARACRARAGQGNDAEGTIGFACRSRHRRMEGTNPLRLYCALMWWRPGRVRTQEETFQGSRNPSSQFMPSVARYLVSGVVIGPKKGTTGTGRNGLRKE